MRRRGLLAAALLILLTAAALMLGAFPAQATSCVGWPDDVADQIVHGRLPNLIGGGGTEAFTQRYDYAVIGTVTAVNGPSTGRGSGEPADARVDVQAALFRPAGPTVMLQMGEVGQILDYPFEIGHTYLVPVKSAGPEGQRNYVILCDPVREVSSSDVAGLLATARSAGVLVTEPSASAAGGTAPTSDTPAVVTPDLATPAQSPGSDRLRWLGLGAIVLLGMAGGAVVVRRRRAIG